MKDSLKNSPHLFREGLKSVFFGITGGNPVLKKKVPEGDIRSTGSVPSCLGTEMALCYGGKANDIQKD
jgi:hypothetical protein